VDVEIIQIWVVETVPDRPIDWESGRIVNVEASVEGEIGHIGEIIRM
jgi:hypothetical protein